MQTGLHRLVLIYPKVCKPLAAGLCHSVHVPSASDRSTGHPQPIKRTPPPLFQFQLFLFQQSAPFGSGTRKEEKTKVK
jgi:hypothetical protein